jgi:phosphosulfolactate phosphohydrolase-like enzyme
MVDAAGLTSERWTDSALLAQRLYETERADLPGALSRSRNGRRLLSRTDLADDVAYCAQLDVLAVAGVLQPDGMVRKVVD